MNTLRRGHRGRTEMVLHVTGKSVHASVPQNGINPLATLARFILALESLEFPVDDTLGPSSVGLTLLRTDQSSANVIPGEIWQTLDWRNVPAEDGEETRSMLQKIAEEAATNGAEVEVTIPIYPQKTYTGERMDIPGNNPAYALEADHPAVRASEEVVARITGRAIETSVWKFATDGSHFAGVGMAPVGIGPGDEFLAHTNREHIEISQLEEALRINAALAVELPVRAVELGFESPH